MAGQFHHGRGRAAAKGQTRRQSRGSPKASQGKYHYVYGPPMSSRFLTVGSRGAVVFRGDPRLRSKGRFKHETRQARRRFSTFRFSIRRNGPVVRQWCRGRAIRWRSLSRGIVPRGAASRAGTTGHHAGNFGGLVGTGHTALLNIRRCRSGSRSWRSMAETAPNGTTRITLPYEPFIGTIGEPRRRSRRSRPLVPELLWRANMDLPGRRSRRPVDLICPSTPRAGLAPISAIGHAAQGDG